MSSRAALLTGAYIDSPTKSGADYGSQYLIGDGLFLAAGHVVYEYNHAHDTKASAVTVSDIVTQYGSSPTITVANDYRSYRSQYAHEVVSEYSGSRTPHLENAKIEAQPSLLVKDSVIISGTGTADSSTVGMTLFLGGGDLAKLPSALNGATVSFDGYVSGRVSGGSITSASSGQLVYNIADKAGDSGGAFLLSYGGKDYVIGTIDALQGSTSLGTYFLPSEWGSINATLAAGHTGNVSASEPTDLIVGTSAADTNAFGTYRSDNVLGLAGNDTLAGESGSLSSTVAWGNDQLYGGLGNDVLKAGYGNDLLHGGDFGTSAHTASQLASDGVDTADYSVLSTVDATKGIKIFVGGTAPDSTFAGTPDIAHAIYVSDLGRQHDTDTLISIEKITGTSADDYLVVNSFDAARFSNSSGNGGLKTIALGGQSTGDTIDLSGLGVGAQVSLNLTTPTVSSIANPSLSLSITGAEKVIGSNFDDKITGSSSADTILGNAGKDTILGGDGNDRLIDGRVTTGPKTYGSVLDGGAGDDTISVAGKTTYATIHGGVGNDKLATDTAILDSYNNDTAFSTATIGIGDGHDIVGTTSSQFEFYNSSVRTIQSQTVSINFTDWNVSDAKIVWDAHVVATVQDNDHNANAYLLEGQMAIVIKSTGESVLLGSVTGEESPNQFTPFEEGPNNYYSLPIFVDFRDDSINSNNDGLLNIDMTFGSTAAYAPSIVG